MSQLMFMKLGAGAGLWFLCLVGCGSKPATRPEAVAVATPPMVLRIAVPDPVRPEDLFPTTRALVAALENAGVGVTAVDGFATNVLGIRGDPEAFARYGANFEHVVAAVRQVVPAPVFANKKVDQANLTLDLFSLERHWDPERRLDPVSMKTLMNIEVQASLLVPLKLLASLTVMPGTAQARHGQLPVLFVSITSPHPKLDEVLRRFRNDHRGVTVDLVESK